MTIKPPKIVFPAFGYAGFSAYYTPAPSTPKISEDFNLRSKTFYGAAFNLLTSFYKHGFAMHLSPNDFQVVHHIDTQGIFSMYFGLSPQSKIDA